MKKFVSGVLCGALLFAGVSVSADAIKSAIVGKKVDGVIAVSVNGKAVEKDAITIEGVSYVPTRALTEAMGGRVSGVTKERIDLVTKDEQIENEEEVPTVVGDDKRVETMFTLEDGIRIKQRELNEATSLEDRARLEGELASLKRLKEEEDALKK